MKLKTIKLLTCHAVIASTLIISTSYAAEPVSVISSTDDGNGPDNTLDNNLDTRWSASGDGEYLQYDLGEMFNINSIDIAFYKGDERTATFEVLTSEDGSDWNPVYSGTPEISTTDQFNVTLTDSIGQYVKVVGYGNTSNSWNSITEVDINTSSIVVSDAPEVPALIQAEDYSGFYDTTAGNKGGEYRTDDVDVQVTSDTDGGYNVGWIKAGEWLEYPINVTTDGTYSADIRVASTKSTGSFIVSVDDSPVGNIDVESTGNWQNWVTKTIELGSLSKGEHTIKVDVTGSNFNLNWFDIKEVADVCDITPDADECKTFCELYPEDEKCKDPDDLIWDWSIWDLEGGDDDLDPVVGNTMVFDALAAQHVTPNGNGWRHELKIDSDHRVAMVDVYEDFQANIKLDISTGSKMIVAQHHADNTDTIMKLYVADGKETGFGDGENGIASDGIFDVYVRLRAVGGGEEKKLLGTIVSGDDFDFHVINNYGTVSVSAMGQTFELEIEGSESSYFKFGNYLQAQYAATGDDVDDSEDWAEFYQSEGITESKLTFSNLSYERSYEGGEVSNDDDKDGVVNDDDLCPNTPLGIAVDSEGCELIDDGLNDDDLDGVHNDDDNCPDTPLGTTVDANGCAIVIVDCDETPDAASCKKPVSELSCTETYSCWSEVNDGTAQVTSSTSLTTTVDGLEDVIAGLSLAGNVTINVTGSGEISIKDKNFAAPVLIKSASLGGASLETATFTNSNNISLEGFNFAAINESNRVKIVNSTNIKVLRNTFDHSGITESQSTLVLTGASQYIEIAYNIFKDKDISNRFTDSWDDKITGSYIKTQFDGPGLIAKNVHIHRNNFSNIKHYIKTGETEVSGDSDREAIAMGIADSQDEVTNNVVEYNLFDNCDGENEIITVKTSNNVFRYNTFKNSMGSLSFRLGNENIALGNYFYGSGASENPDDDNYQTGGVRTYSDGHMIRDNYMEGLSGTTWRLPILVDNGDNSDTLGGDSHQNSTNVLVYNNTLVNNQGGLTIGGTKYGNKPTDITIMDNLVVGNMDILLNEVTSSNNVWSGNKAFAYDDATPGMAQEILSSMPDTPAFWGPLTANDVGVNAQ